MRAHPSGMEEDRVLAEEQATARIDDIQEQLLQEFEGRVSPRVIQESLEESLEAYEGVPIRDFVPLFVYRETRERLMRFPATW